MERRLGVMLNMVELTQARSVSVGGEQLTFTQITTVPTRSGESHDDIFKAADRLGRSTDSNNLDHGERRHAAAGSAPGSADYG